MDKRRYVQRARALSAEETRRRILDAAAETLDRSPLGAVRIEEVARLAGVSRSTIYVVFGSRAGLLEALGYQLRADAGFDRLVEANARPDAREAWRTAARESARMYAWRPRLARALFTLAAIDPDAVSAVAALDDGRRPGMLALARRLHRQGALLQRITAREAADLLTIASSFAAFDELYTGLGLPVETVAERIAALGERAVCRPV